MEADPLLEAVEALTRPSYDHIAQKDDEGRWLRAHTVEHAPLLRQLSEACWPSRESDSAAQAPPSERNVVDVVKLFELTKITSQISDWARMAGAAPSHDPIVNLRRWLVAHRATPDRDDGWHLRTLHGWAHHIRRLLDKPKGFTIHGACPVCGASEWGDAVNGGGIHPLKVEYRLDEDGATPKDMSALCQACLIVWKGRDAVMELAEELGEKIA